MPGMLERVQLVQRVPVMLFDANSAMTIKECRCTAFEGCNIDGCKLSLHHWRGAPLSRWWRCAGGGAAGGGAEEPGGRRYPPPSRYMVWTIRWFGLQKFFFEFRGRSPDSVGHNRCVRCCAA